MNFFLPFVSSESPVPSSSWADLHATTGERGDLFGRKREVVR